MEVGLVGVVCRPAVAVRAVGADAAAPETKKAGLKPALDWVEEAAACGAGGARSGVGGDLVIG